MEAIDEVVVQGVTLGLALGLLGFLLLLLPLAIHDWWSVVAGTSGAQPAANGSTWSSKSEACLDSARRLPC